ncbi:effector-associated constant component EACC1 [Streptomyces sp. NPDC054794]
MDGSITLRTTGIDDIALLERLRAWLLDEPELRGRISPLRSAPDPGHMSGGVLEALVVATGSGVVGVLARSLPIWLRQQRSDVEIEISRESGDSVRIKASNVRNIEALIQETLDQPPAMD